MADDDKKFTQADIDAAIEKATGDVQGLKDKVEELIGDNKKLKAEARKAKDVDPAELHAAEERAEKAEAKAAELEKSVKALTGERDKAVKALETETGFTSKLLIQDGLKTALLANGVKDEDFIASLTAQFGAGASVKADGEARTAMIGDKPLADVIKEWAGTDAGKKYVAAAVNSGGGAGGGNGGGQGAKTVTRAEFDAMSQPDRSKFSIDGGKVVDEAA